MASLSCGCMFGLVVGTGAVNCLESLVFEMICHGTVRRKVVVLVGQF